MAVTTSNRKRPQHWLIANRTHRSPNSSDSHGSKRPRFSAMPKSSTPSLSSSTSAGSRISRYPHSMPPLRREVHAPCRPQKFVSFDVSRTELSLRNAPKEDIDNGRVNALRKYQQARNDALASIRFIEVDSDSDSHSEGVSEDSTVQEVHVVEEDGGEGPSMVTEQRRQESDVVVTEIIHDLDAKVVAEGGLMQQSTPSAVSELSNSNLDVFNTGKMLDNLSLSPKHDLSSVRDYKKSFESVGKRMDALQRLNFEIQLNEKRRATFDLLRPKKELEVPLEPFFPLTKEEKAEIMHAFSANRNKILVTHEKSNIEISVENFWCLRPRAWLNDEVINLYLELLKERENRETQKFLNCHFFNSFFYKRLISGENGYDFNSVRRWTSQKKLGYGLHECDKIFVPIHQENHWCLAVINQRDKKFQYLDSLKGMDTHVLKVLARYFVDEVKDKTGKNIDVSSWEKEFVEDLPEQKNGYDCGVFMIKYADFYSRNLGLCFSQEHMPYFRLRTAKEILRLKAE